MLDLGGGVRAVVERGVLRAERDRRRSLSAAPYLDCGRERPRDRRGPRSSEDLQRRVVELGAGDQRRLRGPRPGHGRGAEGRGDLPRRPDAPHRRALRDRLHGGLQLRLADRLLRGGPDPQGPRRPDRGPRRPDRRGHHRLRPHPPLPDAQPRARNPASLEVCALLAKPDGSGSTSRRATSASRSPTASRSATASITPSTTATSITWLRRRTRAAKPPWYADFSL